MNHKQLHRHLRRRILEILAKHNEFDRLQSDETIHIYHFAGGFGWEERTNCFFTERANHHFGTRRWIRDACVGELHALCLQHHRQLRNFPLGEMRLDAGYCPVYWEFNSAPSFHELAVLALKEPKPRRKVKPMAKPILFTQRENEFLQNILQQYIYGLMKPGSPLEAQLHDSILSKLKEADTLDV